ncbi:MAG: hypothetical protein M1819_004228 [Sarea resinae]|nr:MAG: hypothetical protein M1819_004228 [Sarea resinae]
MGLLQVDAQPQSEVSGSDYDSRFTEDPYMIPQSHFQRPYLPVHPSAAGYQNAYPSPAWLHNVDSFPTHLQNAGSLTRGTEAPIIHYASGPNFFQNTSSTPSDPGLFQTTFSTPSDPDFFENTFSPPSELSGGPFGSNTSPFVPNISGPSLNGMYSQGFLEWPSGSSVPEQGRLLSVDESWGHVGPTEIDDKPSTAATKLLNPDAMHTSAEKIDAHRPGFTDLGQKRATKTNRPDLCKIDAKEEHSAQVLLLRQNREAGLVNQAQSQASEIDRIPESNLIQPCLAETPAYLEVLYDNDSGSDSAYYSAQPAASASVCSFDSSTKSVGLSKDAMQEFISVFADSLVDHLNGHLQGFINNAKDERNLLGNTESFLKEYAIELACMAKPGLERDAVKLVRSYRNRITACFANSLASNDQKTSNIKAHHSRHLANDISLQDIVDTLYLEAGSRPELPSAPIEENDTTSELELDGYKLQFQEVKTFLIGGAPFHRLIEKLREQLELAKDDKMEMISRTVSAAIKRYKPRTNDLARPTTKLDAEYHLHWIPVKFLKSQYEDGVLQPLDAVLAVTGSAINAQATTCAAYMRQIWPVSGPRLLRGIQTSLVADRKEYQNSHNSLPGNPPLSIEIDGNSLKVGIIGTEIDIVECAQQLGWICAACQESPNGGVAYSDAQISQDDPDRLSFDLRTLKTDAREIESRSCWHPLFESPTIARGFPIQKRFHGEVGLELPLEIMAALGGARQAVQF